MAHSAAVPSHAQPICAWSDNSRKFEIHLRPSVMERLATESWVAFKRVPRRGLEIGGVLLGHAEYRGDMTTFWIEGFAAVESEYRSGPSYVPSESDLARLQDEIQKNGPTSIGIFRSHTRSEPLVMREPDDALLQRHFDPGDGLFLMVGPVPGKAALFLRTNGNSHCVHEFPLPSLSSILLARPDLRAQEAAPPVYSDPEIRSAVRPIVRALDPPRKVAVDTLGISDATLDHQAAMPLPLSPREHPLEASEKKDTESQETAISLQPARVHNVKLGRWIMLATVPVLVIAAALTVRFYSTIYSTRGSSGGASSPLEYMRLGIERAGSSLRVHWDRNSPTLRDATHAVLHVQDGEIQVDRIVTPSELNAGSIAYEPKNSDVSFELDVYSAGPHATGMVQVMNLPTPAEIQQTHPPEPQIRPEPRQTPQTTPAAFALRVRPQPALTQPIAKPDEARDILAPVSEPADGAKQTIPVAKAKPSNEIEIKAVGAQDLSVLKVTEKSPQPQVAIISESAATRNLPPNNGPSVSVSAEPVSSSKLARAVGRVPLLRRVTSHENVEPPVPVYEPQPSLPRPNQQRVSQPVVVDVKVDVAESGKVSSAEIVEWGEPPNFSLANAALAAAKQWTFKPARTEDLPVSSQVVLHFHFNP